MQHISIPYVYIDDIEAHGLIESVSALLDGYGAHPISHAPWADGDTGTAAAFSIAYNDDHIFLKYYVTERDIKAEYVKVNDPVYKDSCVEFFISFDKDANYYNLEFNCVGNCFAQYGPNKTNRVFIDRKLVNGIRHQTAISVQDGGVMSWELTLQIPKKVFMYHPSLNLSEASARVNFYKCGDDLQNPHFLCWNRIEAEQPNFHLSEFFKEVSFSR
ncbi:MAG: carbohydrate-binding family 9-like protein [Mucilaginibacter sp.]